jgi:hypothetical protein
MEALLLPVGTATNEKIYTVYRDDYYSLIV